MKTPIPILFTIPNFITAGSGREMLNIVQRLDRAYFTPSICVLKKGGNLDTEITKLGIPLLELPFSIPIHPYRSLLARASDAARPFRPHRFALWHSFHYSDDYSEPIVARLSGAKYWLYTKKNMSWNSNAWYLRSMLASRIVLRNTTMARCFFSGRFLKHKSPWIPPGISTELFRPDLPPRNGLRQQLAIHRDTVVAGCVAHLVPVKGHPTLIEAIARVPSMVLLIVGKPLDRDYVSSLEGLARQFGISERVHFVGGIQDVPALLVELDIFVLPTWAKWRMEGCPLALLEAMSCGRACIATDIPGSRDLVEHGRSGLIVPPEDPAALAEALGRLAADPGLRRTLGASARERVVQRFSIESEVAAHEALYREILGRGRTNGSASPATIGRPESERG